MDSLRLERVLVGVARKVAPWLIPAAWERAGDYQRLAGKSLDNLARNLAANGSLVVFGMLPPTMTTGSALYLQDWADHWVRFHAIFVDGLFPSYKVINAYFLDQELPRAILIHAQAAPVSAAIAAIAAPFVAHMHAQTVTDDDAANAACAMLIKLEAENIARPLRDALIGQAGVHLRLLIKAQVKTISPIAYVPGETLPDIDDTTPIATYDHETSSLMAVTRQLAAETPPPDTLPEARKPVTGKLPSLPFTAVRKQTGELPPPPIPELPKRP